jgi:hypothetical protein
MKMKLIYENQFFFIFLIAQLKDELKNIPNKEPKKAKLK